ncbi:MAG: EexN family lipoprotein [Moraxella sp.]|nr:EexN family lipoprotein [Moraxella sp.]
MKKFFALSLTLALTACGGNKTYTAEYLYENDDVRAKVLEDCKANKESQENCAAASQAQSKKYWDKKTQ